MEKENNWLVKTMIRCLVLGIIFFIGIYLIYDGTTSRFAFSDNQIMNSLAWGVIATVLCFVEAIISKKIKDNRKAR